MRVLKMDLQRALNDIRELVESDADPDVAEKVRAIVDQFPDPDRRPAAYKQLVSRSQQFEQERNSAMYETETIRKSLANHERFLASVCNMCEVAALSSVRTRVADGSLRDVTSMLRDYHPNHVLLDMFDEQ